MAVYVMADVHGLKDKYDALMNVIKDEDTLYVLGDVIDRGPNGIAILLDIMKRDNVKMLMGNHEIMMLEYHNESPNPIDPNYLYAYMDRWCLNGNVSTIREYNELSDEQKQAVLTYLKALPYAFPNVKVNGRTFYLTHGKYVAGCLDTDVVDFAYIQEKGLNTDLFVWNRIEPTDEIVDDRIVIVGHTPTPLMAEKVEPYQIWFNKETIEVSNMIDIDCGCASSNQELRQLALLCLDDLSVQYF